MAKDPSNAPPPVEIRTLTLDNAQQGALALIAIGVALAFYNALVPHGSDAYHLDALLLVLNLLPWLVYGLLITTLRGVVLLGGGVLVLVLHALVTL